MPVPRSRVVLVCSLLVCACARPEPPVSEPREPQASEVSEPAPTSPKIEYRPDLAERIAAAGYRGTFVLLDPASETLVIAEPPPEPGQTARAETGYIPASTFKIPNTLIALETKVASGPEFALAWDGVEREIDEWNRDHTLSTAFSNSVVWFYQELARRIGAESMQRWLDALDYGNRDIGGGIDRFWLDGALRISPREQVEFLRRLHEGTTPLSPATVTMMLDEIMIDERRDDGTIIRAKTGWARAQDFPNPDPSVIGFEGDLGWFVGSVERPDGARVYFAMLLEAPPPRPDSFAADRRELTWTLLRELGRID